MKTVSNDPLINAHYRLIDSQKSLLLSTLSVLYGAEISYAPYVRKNSQFFIYVSELANHTQNMIDNRQASILFIQPEVEAENLFARERLTLKCQVREVQQNESLFDEMLQCMQIQFGETVTVLRTLTDFHLFQLIPISGQYVAGFGKAYSLIFDSKTLTDESF